MSRVQASSAARVNWKVGLTVSQPVCGGNEFDGSRKAVFHQQQVVGCWVGRGGGGEVV